MPYALVIEMVKGRLLHAMEWLPRINTAECIGCAECVAACPTHALAQRDGKAALVNPAACTYCNACEAICPTYAIELPYMVMKLGTAEGDLS